MPTYRYRAATPSGSVRTGALEGASREEVVTQLRRLGLLPIETTAASGGATPDATVRANGQTRQAVVNAIGELAVLLEAGLALDRALAVCVDNIPNPGVKAAFGKIHARVKEGATLSSAMSEAK